MFSVYGVMGRVFSGPVDEMHQVPGIRPLSRSRAVAAIGLDPSASDSGDNQRRSSSLEALSHRSASAYVQAGQPLRHPISQVHEVASPRAFTVPVSTVALEAWQAMADQGVAQAPVVDDKGVLVGMLLRADLLRPELLPGPNAHPLAWRAWLAQSVQEVMWSPVPSVLGDAEIRHVARVLLDSGLPGMPVVDAQGVVTGFVSRSDLLRAMIHDPPLDTWS